MAKSAYFHARLSSESEEHLRIVQEWLSERLPDATQSDAFRAALQLAVEQIMPKKNPEKKSKRA